MATEVGSAYVEIGANIRGLQRGLKDASRQFEMFGRTADRQAQAVAARFASSGDKMAAIGRKMTTRVSLPIAALGTVAVGAAIKFESAFAGVRKTVDATEGEFKRLERGIRDMSLRIPASAESIASVAEAAGQLGIENKSILKFTRTMIDLGNSTNISADDAAQALARLANITSMPQKDFDRLGSTVVALGNNLATTESEIVEMGLRIAGAGKQVGLTEAQIMGFAGALSSVGMEAQAGGSSVSRALLNMQNSVMQGGDKLQAFSKVAGMSAQQFAKQFKTAPQQAMVSFVQGLQRIQRSGGNVVEALASVGMKELRVRDAFLRLAGANDLLVDSLALGTKSWQENTALTKEAGQRYKTAASQLQILRNRASEIARTFGEAMVPFLLAAADAIKPLADGIQAVAQGFKQLPGPVRTAIGGLIAFTAALGPVLWIGGKVSGAVGKIILAMSALKAAGTVASAHAMGLAPGLTMAQAGMARTGRATGLLGRSVQGLGMALPLMATPLGLVAGAAVAGAAGLLIFGKRTNAAAERQGYLASLSRDAAAAVRSVADGLTAQADATDRLISASDRARATRDKAREAEQKYQDVLKGQAPGETRIAWERRLDSTLREKLRTMGQARQAEGAVNAAVQASVQANSKSTASTLGNVRSLQQKRQELGQVMRAAVMGNASEGEREKIAQRVVSVEANLSRAIRTRTGDIKTQIEANKLAQRAVEQSAASDDAKAAALVTLRNDAKTLNSELRKTGGIKATPEVRLAENNAPKRLDAIRSALGLIPARKPITVTANTDQATGALNPLVALLSNVRDKNITVTTTKVERGGGKPGAGGFRGGYAQRLAGGGVVRGPAGRDVIPAMLTRGEVVLTRQQQRMVDRGMSIRDAIRKTGGAYAKGGAVGAIGAQISAARKVEETRKKSLAAAIKSKDKNAIKKAQTAYNNAKKTRERLEGERDKLKSLTQQAGEAFVQMELAKFDEQAQANLKQVERTFVGSINGVAMSFRDLDKDTANRLKNVERNFKGTGEFAGMTFRGFEKAMRNARAELTTFYNQLTPAEAQIKALQDAGQMEDLQGNLAEAQSELAKVRRWGGSPQEIAAAEKKLREAERAMLLSELQKTAEAERAQREIDRQAAEDDFDELWDGKRMRLQDQLDAQLEAEREAGEDRRQLLQDQLDGALAAQASADAQARVQRQHELEDQAAVFAARSMMLQGSIKDTLNRMKSFGRLLEVRGKRIGISLASGIAAAQSVVKAEADKLAQIIANYLQTKSPTKLGPMSTLDTWWDGLAPALASGLDTRSMERSIASATAAPSIMAGAGVSPNITISIDVSDQTFAGMSREQADRVARQIKAALDRRVSYSF